MMVSGSLATIRASEGYKDDYNKFWPYADTDISSDKKKWKALTKYAKDKEITINQEAYDEKTEAAKAARDKCF